MKKKRKRRQKVSDQIRRLIDSSGMSRYRIAMRSGIDQSALSRFMTGERGLSMVALDALGELLDFEVVMHGPRRS
ncbi:MAG: helix-turn-helix domain-containing protein [Planctomycetota bacterium]|jgi:transcriptional regulator with XRE-family HTH domain